ncbi:MAG: UDP-N-acetylglucosamine--N-acetylmuramyl-(pentapeptide) pyrophosphoryl-undecaprenol [Patescibacteria group bacterium]|nr:UDP-N-acetylglucosamine--N-acetylmuramyl-(pentapeptide) pyrophosphoryl-undecaprenol [Patescibacteria group bacterium]
MLAVAHELKQIQPKVDLIYAIGKGDKLAHLPHEDAVISQVFSIRSGKFRRYHGEGWKQLFDIPTLVKNIRDFFFVLIGFIQSIILLKKEKPDVIFIKGGFVAVPVGLAAALLRIPYMTHDSDAVPGLANRIISKWAYIHAVAMPLDNYSYEVAKMKQVGVPISSKYQVVNRANQKKFIREIGIADEDAQVLLITGGGLGAQRLNTAITKIARQLLAKNPSVYIVHIAGPKKAKLLSQEYESQLKGDPNDRIIIKEFVDDLYRYSGAADVIIARAGANSLTEFAAQQKACIIIPNPQLTGGHQLKNAESLANQGAITQISDESVQKNPELLLREVRLLLGSVHERAKLATQFHSLSDDKAAEKIALMILDQLKEK